MAELKHIKTFENYSTPEVEEVVEQIEETEEINEGVLDRRKIKIDKFLAKPEEGKKADAALSVAFAKAFGANPKLKADVLAQPHEEKMRLLKKASEVLSDPKIGPLKAIKRGGVYDIGGVGVVAGSGGGHKG